jgi:signal transduction histidine kinase
MHADNVRMTQVLINLLENAHNHSPANAEILLAVRCDNPVMVAFSVKDRGTGIAPDLLERVFEPFYTTRNGGTGLGLSIVRHIVKSHGGTITAFNNTDGPGTTFEVVIPRAKNN